MDQKLFVLFTFILKNNLIAERHKCGLTCTEVSKQTKGKMLNGAGWQGVMEVSGGGAEKFTCFITTHHTITPQSQNLLCLILHNCLITAVWLGGDVVSDFKEMWHLWCTQTPSWCVYFPHSVLTERLRTQIPREGRLQAGRKMKKRRRRTTRRRKHTEREEGWRVWKLRDAVSPNPQRHLHYLPKMAANSPPYIKWVTRWNTRKWLISETRLQNGLWVFCILAGKSVICPSDSSGRDMLLQLPWRQSSWWQVRPVPFCQDVCMHVEHTQHHIRCYARSSVSAASNVWGFSGASECC